MTKHLNVIDLFLSTMNDESTYYYFDYNMRKDKVSQDIGVPCDECKYNINNLNDLKRHKLSRHIHVNENGNDCYKVCEIFWLLQNVGLT